MLLTYTGGLMGSQALSCSSIVQGHHPDMALTSSIEGYSVLIAIMDVLLLSKTQRQESDFCRCW